MYISHDAGRDCLDFQHSIMIVVDNSHYVPRDGDMFKTQFETSRLYCRSKFKSNPKTRVGVATLGCGADLWPPSPDSDIEHFMTHRLGPCHGYLTEYILKIGKRLKENNIALDVVSFPHQDQEFDALKTITLRSFVAAANINKDNNSHFPRVPRLISYSPSEAQRYALTEEDEKEEEE
ncbi:26S proteasome non-ATPase regulatory subunit 4 [Tanacetum coccineum]